MDCGNMRTGLEALYFLDNALTDPSEDYLRIINKEENETYLKYIVDNGSGDTLYVIFMEDIVLIKGFAHESSLLKRSLIEVLYKRYMTVLMKNIFRFLMTGK